MGKAVLYTRFKSVAQFGNPPAQDTLNFSTDFWHNYLSMFGITEFFPENVNLRGSESLRIGDRLLFGTIELRQKLIEGDLPVNILGFTGGDITGAIISDFGNVWNGVEETGDFITTAGFEIKCSFKSGSMPIMIFAYGYADEIKNITNINELNHYYRMALINPF